MSALQAIDTAMDEIATAEKIVRRGRHRQIRGNDQRALLKSTAYAWFRTHRVAIKRTSDTLEFSEVDGPYQVILDSTERFAAKATYLDALKEAKAALVQLRAAVLAAPSASSAIDDLAPDFSPLVSNPEMRGVLQRRWLECAKCVKATAHLAAIVMMGGLLEALFVARANAMHDKKPLLKAVAAPIDKTTGKTINYQEWMLDSYIKVGHELGWLTHSARQVADVLKEYRNYIHPEKELRHKVELQYNDSALFWQVTKELIRQLLASASG